MINKLIKLLLLSGFILVFHVTSHAEEKKTSPLSPSSWNEITKDLKYPDGHYKELKPNGKDKEENSFDLSFFKYPIYALVICILAYLIYRLILTILEPTNKKVDGLIHYEEIDPETLPISDLEILLKNAITKGELRNAIRYYYLIALKNLTDNNLIFHSKDKTNYDYLTELADRPSAKSFREITRAFEITWYGEITPDQNTFRKFENSFTALTESIKTKKDEQAN